VQSAYTVQLQGMELILPLAGTSPDISEDSPIKASMIQAA
jgi:hypothetical protein